MEIQTTTLTRASFWLTLGVSVALGVLALYAKFSALGSPLESLTLDPKADVTYESGQIPAHVIVAKFAEVLRRNTGRTSVPESELPHSREAIRKAIITAPQWAKDFHSPSGHELFGALLVALENFVPSPERIAPETVWTNQRKAILALGFEFRVVAYDGPRPIPIGDGDKALKDMRFYREAQMAGFVAFLVFMGFLGVRLLTLLIKVLRKKPRARWSGWGFIGYWIVASPAVGLTGFLAAWIPTSIATLSEGSTTANAAVVGLLYVLVIGFGLLAPLFVSSALFDILVSPGIGRLSADRFGPDVTLQSLADGGTASRSRKWFHLLVAAGLFLIGFFFLSTLLLDLVTGKVNLDFAERFWGALIGIAAWWWAYSFLKRGLTRRLTLGRTDGPKLS